MSITGINPSAALAATALKPVVIPPPTPRSRTHALAILVAAQHLPDGSAKTASTYLRSIHEEVAAATRDGTRSSARQSVSRQPLQLPIDPHAKLEAQEQIDLGHVETLVHDGLFDTLRGFSLGLLASDAHVLGGADGARVRDDLENLLSELDVPPAGIREALQEYDQLLAAKGGATPPGSADVSTPASAAPGTAGIPPGAQFA